MFGFGKVNFPVKPPNACVLLRNMVVCVVESFSRNITELEYKMSNYPEGVTGMEREISGGGVGSEVREVECEDCRFVGEIFVEFEVFGDWQEFWWDCPECGEHVFDEGSFVVSDYDER